MPFFHYPIVLVIVISIIQYTILIMQYISSQSGINTYCKMYWKIHRIVRDTNCGVLIHSILRYNDTKISQNAV